MFRIVFLLFSSLIFFSCCKEKKRAITLPYYNEPDFTPIFVKENKDLHKIITHTISDFSFLNQDSVLITQDIVKNKIHIANFIFTTCGSICPSMTKNFKIVGDTFINDTGVVLLSYSVTPWIDQPSRLKKYMAANGIKNKNWEFLTGDRVAIYNLARQSYFAEEDLGFSKDSKEFLHTEHFILVDKTGRIRGIYNGTLSLEMHQLMDDINNLKEEK